MQTVDKKLKSHDAWALFLSIGGGLCFGTSIGIIGGILGDEKFIGLSPSMRGVFSASAAYGIVIGSILPTFLSEIFGRKPMFIFAAFEAFIFTALISAMNSTAGCIIMRALAGIGSGALSATTPAYSAELASDKWRGKFVGLIRVTTMGGVALSQLINIPFNYVKNGWRWFGIGLIF
ncbi:MAG: hypothetical protein EZS28_005842 [Streblomastix strix]|uniref:Major facilitator superfamily (MFS) profile domain-containing protein n=1 Tax=Streblomastix strix TaxID=222440 RepID=A0A5J4WVT7_9EUKA|nr:MAG: hypothetical protein EZS28_005842 [Streblomastix strix]